MKVWVTHRLENRCLTRADDISSEAVQGQQRWPSFVLKPPIPEPQLLPLWWQKEDVYPSQRRELSSPSGDRPATEGPPHGVCGRREGPRSLTAGAAPRPPSLHYGPLPSLPAAGTPRLRSRPPASHPGLPASCQPAPTGSLPAAVSSGKRAVCARSLGSPVKSAGRAAQQGDRWSVKAKVSPARRPSLGPACAL